jgi:pre-mRNA-splicing factor CWC26
LKRKEHDDDPLLSFRPSSSKKHVSLTGRKLYRGGFPENRFGIAPGHRWDGVDRSNGFEAKWFKKQVEKERAKTLSYTMQEEY